MNINCYRRTKTKNYLFLNIENDIKNENDFLNKLAAILSKDTDIFEIKNTKLSTANFLELAEKIKLICAEFNIIFLISDRSDIAFAINCDGVCLGENEISAHTARHILSEEKIIGSKKLSENDADFFIADKITQPNPDKIYFSKTETKQFQGNCLVYLSRAYS